MLISYTVKLTVLNNINNSSVIFNKSFESEITTINESALYDNYHVIHSSVYVLDLFLQEVKDYCEAESITIDDIVIDEYEIVTFTENAEVFFENPVNVNAFTLTPDIKCYIYPKELPLPAPTLYGTSYDSNTIIWTWPEDEQYAHYLISEPVDFNSESDKTKIIATIPIGAKHYIETGLEPNTAYSRRLINYTDTQTSLPSAETTVITETVNPQISLEEYNIQREHDWTITDAEREVIKENLTAFKSGIGDLNDLKVYKQMDKDFYEKFKAYFTLTGKYTQREKRYDQVGFNYKICLEAKETIEEQEGEVTFKLDAYPWQEIYKTEYVWATKPVTIHAKVCAYVDLFKTTVETEEGDADINFKEQSINSPSVYLICFDLSGSMKGTRFTKAVKGMLNFLNQLKEERDKYGLAKEDVMVGVIGFARSVKVLELDNSADYESEVDSSESGENVGDSDDFEVEDEKYGLVTLEDAIKFFKASSVQNGTNSRFKPTRINKVDIGVHTHWPNALRKTQKMASKIIKNRNVIIGFFTDGFPFCSNASTGITSSTWYEYYTDKPEEKHTVVNGKLAIGTSELLYAVKNTMKRINSISNKGHTLYKMAFLTAKVSNASSDSAAASEMDSGWTQNTAGSKTWANNIRTALETAFDSVQMGISDNELEEKFKELITWEERKGSSNISVEVPVEKVDYKTVLLQSAPVTFTIDSTLTPVGYDDLVNRAVVLQKLPLTQMSNISILQLLTNALMSTPEWADGYQLVEEAVDENGNILGTVFKNVHIIDGYAYGDEDPLPSLSFNANYNYGMMGTINVTSNIPTLSTPDHTDDLYVATDDSFLFISGYTNAIIYECVRYGRVAVNAYSRPKVTMFYRMDLAYLLKNRENKNYTYGSANIDTAHVFKKELTFKAPNPCYTQVYGDGIDQDTIAEISTHWESPILNYRFNLLDPDAFTPYYEILPECNPASQDKHLIILTVYYAKNVEINSTSLNDNYYALFDYTNPAKNPLKFIYGTNATWNSQKNVFDCDGHWIHQFVHFFARKMEKTIDYYDELPGEGMDSMYGLVNGRYREDNLSGKQDLTVQVPQFNIPKSVLNKHADTVKIYVMVTEFYPSDALVSYKWHHENPVGSGFTKVNGDYITFSSDSITYKDIDYYETLATYETEQIELFNQKPYEMMQGITRPNGNDLTTKEMHYTYSNIDDAWKTNCELSGDNILQMNQGGTLVGPFVSLAKGRYTIVAGGDNLTSCIFSCNAGTEEIPMQIERHDNERIIYRIILFEDKTDIEFKFSCNVSAENPVYMEGYYVDKTTDKYDNYYINIETDNSDVLATRYPNEIVFDDNDNCTIPVTYRGVVNATSMWSPRIHNGYYYTNQHEKFLYSEFKVDADFDRTEETYYDEGTVFVNFDVSLRKKAGAKEDYDIVKNTIAELLQDENNFTWIKDEGLTLRPVIEGQRYKHYEAKTWTSPVVLFDNPLTVANALNLDYINTDGSNTGLDLYVRSFNLEEGTWTEWVPFVNNTVPNTPLSCAYQIRTILSATEQHTEYETEDYLCCYLDWVDYVDENLSDNIVTITDHITTGPYYAKGIVISKILRYACPSGISLDMFSSNNNKVVMSVAFSNNINDLILENIVWQPMSSATLDMGYKYYRFRIEIAQDEKVYWVHLKEKSLETTAVLPYIKSISMSGSYTPEDTLGHFLKLESFKITKDGLFHEIIPKINNYISAEVINRGFELTEIESIDIKSTNPDVYLLFDTEILKPNPDISLLYGSISAATSEVTVDTINLLPYIFTKDNKITITGTPQQYCPITVEDINGMSLKEIYNVNPKDMLLTEIHTMNVKENYIELERNDFELDTITVWINDDKVTDYTIVNHLLMFKNFLEVGDVVTVTYNIENSFYTEVDRKNNTTTIYPYSNKTTFNDPDVKVFLEEYKGMTLQEIYASGLRFSNTTASNTSHANTKEENSWTFDTSLNSFITSVNSVSFNGFIATQSLNAYEHEVTIVSSNSDDDVNGVVIGYVTDDEGLMHTISFLVTRGGWSTINHYALVYDFCLPTQKILQVIKDPAFPSGGWSSYPNGIRIKITKSLNNITCQASIWNDPNTWNPNTYIEFDLNSDVDTEKFADEVYYGYCNQSQSHSYFINVAFKAYIARKIIKRYKVMFETNEQTNKFVAKKLSLNPVYRTDYSGFIYLTEEHNIPDKIKIWCNPKRVKAGGFDSVDIQIEVLDLYNNPVIAKEITIDCKNGTLICDNYETDMNGVVHAVYKSSSLKGADTITAKVLLDDELTNLQESIEIISY